MHKLQGYLLGKYFECETDHNNLKWIEASLNPAIIRMRVFLQSFHFDVRHIPGRLNLVADYLSRYHESKSEGVASVSVNKYDEEFNHIQLMDEDAWDNFELARLALTNTERSVLKSWSNGSNTSWRSLNEICGGACSGTCCLDHSAYQRFLLGKGFCWVT